MRIISHTNLHSSLQRRFNFSVSELFPAWTSHNSILNCANLINNRARFLITFAMLTAICYDLFFNFPQIYNGIAVCKLCKNKSKYSKNSKGNLLKHLSNNDGSILENHKKELDKSKTNLLLGQSSIQLTPTGLKSESVCTRQKAVKRSIAVDLCARGCLPLTLCEKPCF